MMAKATTTTTTTSNTVSNTVKSHKETSNAIILMYNPYILCKA